VVGVWIALLVLGGALSKSLLSGALTTSADFTNHPESRQAQQLLEQRLTGPRHANEIVIIHSDTATVDDPAFQSDVEKLAAAVRATHVVERVSAFPQRPDPSVVSKDRHTELMPMVMSGSIDDATNNIDQVLAVTLHAPQPAGFRILVAGEATAGDDFKTLAENDLKKGEGFGIIMALLILLVVFGAVAAAVVPIILAVMSIAIATGGNLVWPHVVDAVIDAQGVSHPVHSRVVRQVISPHAAQQMQQMMVSVVEHGSGFAARIEGFKNLIAGKTGTASIPENGGYSKTDTIGSFIGYLPTDHPKFILMVVVRKPQVLFEGAYVAAPIFKTVASALITQWQIAP
jgi:hypothetical protein